MAPPREGRTPADLFTRQSGVRLEIAAAGLPRGADGPITWGELIARHDLGAEALRRSLAASYRREYSLAEANAWRTRPVDDADPVILVVD
jgi:hypothetical protein